MKDFENVFNEEEFLEEDFSEVDALIEAISHYPRAEVSIVNPYRAQALRFSAAMMKKVLRDTGSNASIVCKVHEQFPSIGVIRVEGVSIDILDIEGFSRAAEFASNTEIYPLKGNKVRMTFTFHGLLKGM